jgi:hypothetical protein
VPGSRGGFGWAQWTGARRQEFEAWCRDNGLDPASDAANYGYLVHELKTKNPHILAKLKSGSLTAEQAADAFFEFESGNAPELEKHRAGHVVNAQQIAGFGPPAPSVAPGVGGPVAPRPVNIGTINIVTRADDARGISREIRQELRGAIGAADTGLE